MECVFPPCPRLTHVDEMIGEDQPTESGEKIRLTHIIVPSLVRPKAPPATHALLTPETSDLSAPSSSDRNTSGTESDHETESDAGTEMGDEIGYSLEPEPTPASQTQGSPPTPSFEDAMAELYLHSRTEPLSRAISASSSLYASSEAESDGSGMADSLMLPIPPASNGGWTMLNAAGSDGGRRAEPKPLSRVALGSVRRRGWEVRPTFLEYLYGA
jgi:hypothetical protein